MRLRYARRIYLYKYNLYLDFGWIVPDFTYCVSQAVTTTSQMLVARKMAPFIQKVTLWTAQHILHNLHYKVLDWERTLLAVDPWNAAALHKLAEQILAGVTHKYGNVGFGMVISERLQAIYDELVGADASFAKVKKRSEKLAKKARRAAANSTSPDFPWDHTVPSMWVVPPQPAAAETGANVPRKPKEVSAPRVLQQNYVTVTHLLCRDK
jgi:hypothetical protein